MNRPHPALVLGFLGVSIGLCGCGAESVSTPAPAARTAAAATARPSLDQLAASTTAAPRPTLALAQEALASRLDHTIRQRLRAKQPYLDDATLDEVAAEFEDLLTSHGPIDDWIGEVRWTRPVDWQMEPLRMMDVSTVPIWSPYRVEIEIPCLADYAWGFEAYCVTPALQEWHAPGFPRRPIGEGDTVRFRATPGPDAKVRWYGDDDRDRFVYGPVYLSLIERLEKPTNSDALPE